MAFSMERVLALWRVGLLSEGEVIDWADRRILAVEPPSDALVELSLHGPQKYLNLPAADFPRLESLSFEEEFSLRASALDLASNPEGQSFVRWLAGACMGRDLAEPEVALGYRVDHLWNDCDDMPAAIAFLRENLPALLPQCRARSAPFWAAFDPGSTPDEDRRVH